jgi:hypothetical protein
MATPQNFLAFSHTHPFLHRTIGQTPLAFSKLLPTKFCRMVASVNQYRPFCRPLYESEKLSRTPQIHHRFFLSTLVGKSNPPNRSTPVVSLKLSVIPASSAQ